MARERKPSAKALEAAQNAQEQEDENDEPKVRGPKGKKRVAAEADEYQPEEESAKDDDEYQPEAASKKTTKKKAPAPAAAATRPELPRDFCGFSIEYATTGRAACKEFRCARNIKLGELRIASHYDGGEGFQRNWYCFAPKCGGEACLWKVLKFRKGAGDPRYGATSAKLQAQWRGGGGLPGLSLLCEEDRAMVVALLDSTAAPPPPMVASTVGKSVTISAAPGPRPGDVVRVGGSTFEAKDALKAKLGARWHGTAKEWMIEDADALCGVCGASAQALPITVQLDVLLAALATLPDKNPASAPAGGAAAASQVADD